MDPCIICLDDNPPVNIYKGKCNCHPTIHNDCMNEWYSVNPNTCPICLIKPRNIIIINRIKICMFLCVIYISCIFLGPLFLIWLILALQRPGTTHHHHRNMTVVL